MTLLADPLTLVVAVLAVCVVGLAKGGFAGLGVLATPMLAMVMPASAAAAILLPVLIVQDVVSVWSFRHSWDRWIVAWMLPGAALGVLLASLYAAAVDEAALRLALGLIALCFGLYRLWAERGGRILAPSTSPGWVGMLFGVATGVTSQIAHAGGPPFQIWVAPRRLPHQTFVGTSSVLFAAVNWTKVPSFLALGTLNQEIFIAALLLLPVAVLSTLVAVRVIRRLDGQRYYTLIYLLMVLLGAKLVWDGLV